jgi:uncharacterized PurR-regulated membrane protein YhhQ (DUF165 family)
MSHRSSSQTMSTSHEDRWLLPRQQAEYPAWDFLPEETLHGRREATFLVLGAAFLVTTTSLVVLGTSRVIDPTPTLAALLPDLALPFAMQIPFGVLPFALGGLALSLVCELYSRRRAAALVVTGLLACIALGGLMWLADRVDGRNAAFGPAVGFVSCYLIGYLLYVPLFDALRRRMAGRHLWLRLLVLSPVAQLAGWTAFGAAMYGYATWLVPTGPVDMTTITALATGSALYTFACTVVLILPIALVARGLRLYLRVAHEEDEDDEDSYREGPGVRIRRLSAEMVDDAPARRRWPQPFSSTEMRFFAEGDRLAESGAER